MNGGSRPGLWMPERLLFWVQDLPGYVHLILMLAGALAGYLYATSTGASVKVCVFAGALIGLVSLFLVVWLIGLIVTIAVLGGFALILYNVFIVPAGESWKFPSLPSLSEYGAPLANETLDMNLIAPFSPSTAQIADIPTRLAVENQIAAFHAKGFRIVRCTYGPLEDERGRRFASYDFWHEQSPVTRPDFPRLPPVPIAVLRDFAISACPPTRPAADKLWRRALAAR